MGTRTRAALAAVTLVVAAVAPVLGAGAAHAATYRYWTYWWGANTPSTHSGWRFASAGPASQAITADGQVVGWRFATTSTVGSARPRASASYGDLCSGQPAAPAGRFRVAVVTDFGSSADWPPGETPPVTSSVVVTCVTVSDQVGASANKALAAIGAADLALRQSPDGLVCGIDGFPRTECAPIVADPKPTPSPTRTTPAATPTASHPAGTTTSSAAAPAGTSSTAVSSAASASASAPASASASTSTSSTASAASSPLAVTGSTPSPSASESLLPTLSAVPVAAAGEAGSSSSPWGAIGGVALVAAVGGAAWWTMRRGGTR